MRRNSWKAALAAFEKSDFKTRKGLGNGTVIYLKGLCFERLGRADEARVAFRDVIDNWPDATLGTGSVERLVFFAYEGLGRLHLSAHETDQAQTVMEEGVARTGASLDLHLRLARLYLDYHMPDRAGALMEAATARDLAQGNGELLLSAYLLWARLGAQARDSASLNRLVERLDAQADRLAALHDYLRDLDAMRVYSIAGRADRAVPILKRGLKAGYIRIEWLAADPDLEPLRATSDYRELLRAERPPRATPPTGPSRSLAPGAPPPSL
jgi:tetratricopeptide (TPR) repeat protein